jgi:polyhydroxyalkanoate synthesis repressor PhaR
MVERVIRKYANRRLYDPAESRHLTLDEVRQLIVSGEKVRVEDARSGEDITRSILLQIIVEREEAGRPMLSADLLEQLIRFYGGAMQDFLGNYLERSVDSFVNQQERFQEQLMKLMTENPMSAMAGIAEQNLAAWKELQERFLGMPSTRPQKSEKSKKDDK